MASDERPSRAALDWLNALPPSEASAVLRCCCGAARWVEAMLLRRPFPSPAALLKEAEVAWGQLATRDFLEAFSHHPEIGANLDELRRKFAETAELSLGEQAGALSAGEVTLSALRSQNQAYRARFGYSFIVCATGKTAAEMLDLLQARLGNAPEVELGVAAAEQAKITRLRLEKLSMSRITTHVLDTSRGKPVAGVPVSLSIRDASGFRELSRGVTDSDGRLRDLLPSYPLEVASYRLVFEVAGYFRADARPSFFEQVTLDFHVSEPGEHYHVPLLLSPFGYSTYRGS